jgi:hypothetical protein
LQKYKNQLKQPVLFGNRYSSSGDAFIYLLSLSIFMAETNSLGELYIFFLLNIVGVASILSFSANSIVSD